jgi:hypothetical protein
MRFASPKTLALTAGFAASSTHAQWQAVVLHPGGVYLTEVFAVSGARQFGSRSNGGLIQPAIWMGTSATSSFFVANPNESGKVYAAWSQWQGGVVNGHASLWQGTPESRVDLHPFGFDNSSVLGLGPGQQVGEVRLGGYSRAALWTGSVGSYQSLHPSGFTESVAVGSDGTRQAGSTYGGGAGFRPVMWAGTPQSMISLLPHGVVAGQVHGVFADQQVGYASYVGIGTQAALWRGSAESYINLNPPGAGWSMAAATCGVAQAGGATLPGYGGTAGVWFGTAESFVPLGPYLPPTHPEALANSITYHNGRLYVGGYGTNIQTGNIEAILWIGPGPCYPNCDGSSAAPQLNIADFTCFLQSFAAGEAYANCDGSTAAPALNVADFVCFLQRFAAGCP